MNYSSIIGLLISVGVMYGAMTGATDNMDFFLDFHGILIVCGGTLAASSVSYSIKDIFTLMRVFFLRVLGRNQPNIKEVISQLIEVHKKYTLGNNAINDLLPTLKHPFLREAVSLLSTGVLNEQELRNTLEQRLKTIETEYMHDANMLRTIGRFPPAFGLMATTLGMIGLLQKIGQPDSQKLIGPAMSVGLIGTLYGIALANLVFIPIAENLTERTHEEVRARKLIIEGILMLKIQANPIAVRELLNSYLLPKQRLDRRASP
jgi:chemotaxis protein MotA